MTYNYVKLRKAAEKAAVAFHGVAESCRGTKTPLDTADALRVASLALEDMAEQFELLHTEFNQATRGDR